jgi:hypothetical protein
MSPDVRAAAERLRRAVSQSTHTVLMVDTADLRAILAPQPDVGLRVQASARGIAIDLYRDELTERGVAEAARRFVACSNAARELVRRGGASLEQIENATWDTETALKRLRAAMGE